MPRGDWVLLGSGAWITTRLVNGVGCVPIVITPEVLDTTPRPVRQVTVQVVTVQVAPACKCPGDLYNCDDFGSATSAQKCCELCKQQTGKDVHRLDGDGDGWACEFTGW
jgi:hypothetical protein